MRLRPATDRSPALIFRADALSPFPKGAEAVTEDQLKAVSENQVNLHTLEGVKAAAIAEGYQKQAEYAQKIQDIALENIEAFYEMNEQMREYYADVIDEGISKIQELTKHFDNLTGRLGHYSNILSLMG